MIDEDEIQSRNIRIIAGANPWARISEVAAKVGVKPCSEGPPSQPTIKATGADGQQYDVWEVIVAVLDKIDGAVAPLNICPDCGNIRESGKPCAACLGGLD